MLGAPSKSVAVYIKAEGYGSQRPTTAAGGVSMSSCERIGVAHRS